MRPSPFSQFPLGTSVATPQVNPMVQQMTQQAQKLIDAPWATEQQMDRRQRATGSPVERSVVGHGPEGFQLPHRDGMSDEAEAAWSKLNSIWGSPLGDPTSAYRDPAHNARVGGAKGSQHINGNAYDYSVKGWEEAKRIQLLQAAQQAGFTGFGVYDNSMHFDVGPKRAWGSSYKRDSLPQYAVPYVG